MIEKNLALESESQGSTLSLITEGVQASKLWFHHYTMMTPNTSGHCRHILVAWAIWAPEAPHILAALCHLWLIQENTWLLLCLCLRMRKLVKYFRTSQESHNMPNKITALLQAPPHSKCEARECGKIDRHVFSPDDLFLHKPHRPTLKPLLPKF